MKRIRKIIKEILKETFINEGSDLLVKNFPYDEEETETVGDISRFVMKKFVNELLPTLSLTKEEERNIDNLLDVFTVDGDYFEKTGTMSIYPERVLHERYLDKIISFTKYILNEEDIYLGEVVKEPWSKVLTPEKMKEYKLAKDSTRVISFPIVKNDSHNEEEHQKIHLSDSTWKKMFDILGFDEYMFVNIDASELLLKISNGKKKIESMDNFDIDNDGDDYDVSYDIRMQQHGHIFNDIKDKNYMLKIMNQVEEVAIWALSNGYTSLYIG